MADEPNNLPDPAQAFQSLLAKKNNDATALASQLFDENFQLRQKNREIAGKVPAEGSLVLTAEEAKEHSKFKTFLAESKLDFKTLKETVEKVSTLETANKELSGMETLRELSEVGLDGSKLKISVLKDLMQKYPEASFRFATEKDKDGTESKVAFIKNGDTESPFSDFAAQNLSDYLPSLKVSAEQTPLVPGTPPDPKPHDKTGGIFDRIRKSVTEADKPEAVNIDQRFGKAA